MESAVHAYPTQVGRRIEIAQAATLQSIGMGLVAGIFGLAVSLIILNGAAKAGLSAAQSASWIFGVYCFGGLLSVIMSIAQRQPISFSWSIPGTALVLSALQGHPLPELVGAYLVAGLIVLAISLTGLVGRIVTVLPFPIVVAMIAGILMKFALGVVGAGQKQPMIIGVATIAYFLAARFTPRIPAVLAAFVAGIAATALVGKLHLSPDTLIFVAPRLVMPSWSASAVASVSIPLALLIVCAENVKGVGILRAAGYHPPADKMLLASGVGTLLCAFFGGHNLNVAGPMTAICASDEAGKAEERFFASVSQGIVYVAFGVVASISVGFVMALPGELIAAIAGLAMISPLTVALSSAFGGKTFQVGAIVSFVIGSTDLSIFGIGSPLWALAFGVIASLLVERASFDKSRP